MGLFLMKNAKQMIFVSVLSGLIVFAITSYLQPRKPQNFNNFA